MRKALLVTIFMVSLQLFAQKTVSVTTAGTLSALLTVSEQKTVTTLSVSGNIDARDFAFMRDKITNLSVINLSGATIKAYTGTAGTNPNVQTTYPAGEIPEYAFYNPALLTYKSGLTAVTLPATTVSIGKLAFYFCWNLTGMTIPASVKSIADYSFYGCYGITSFSVASSNTRYSSASGVIFNEAQDTLFVFPNAKTGNYVIPSTVKHIYKSAFENAYAVTTITLPTSLLSIGSYAFSYCSGINGNLTLPVNLTKLEDGAFYGCYNLTGTVSIPASLTEIGSYCFLECNNIRSFTVNASNPDYSSQDDIFYSINKDSLFICPAAKTGAITIPSTVKLIGSYAFYNCKNLTGTINIPALVNYIGYYAFYGCSLVTEYVADPQNQFFSTQDKLLYSKIKDRLLICPTSFSGSYVLPETLISIDPGAFNNCTALTGKVHLPATLNWIGEYAFYNCTGITGFTTDPDNSYFSAADDILFSKNMDTLYICPLSKSGNYQIPAGTKVIGASAFDGCTGLTGIQLPTALENIGSYAFEYCTTLTELLIPQNVKSIGAGAFYSCTGLQKLSVGITSPPVIDYYALDQVNKTLCSLYVPLGSAETYRNAPYWSSFIQINETSFNTGVEYKKQPEYKLVSWQGKLTISGLQPGTDVNIYDLHGKLVRSELSRSSNMQLTMPFRGIFILEIGSFTEKIIL